MTQLVILGAGGHGAVAAEAATLSNRWSNVVFLDDTKERPDSVVECPIVGKFDGWKEFAHATTEFHVAVGDSGRRLALINELIANGVSLATKSLPAKRRGI